jgi:hypothetical protein
MSIHDRFAPILFHSAFELEGGDDNLTSVRAVARDGVD